MIKAIFFDLDDTLCDRSQALDICLPRVWQRLRAKSKLTVPGDTFAEIVEQNSTPFRTRRERFESALHALGEPNRDWTSNLPEELAALYTECMKEHLQLFDGVETTLRALRTDFFLALITNAPPESQRGKVADLMVSEFVDRVVLTDDVGAYKPDPAIFLHAVRLANVTPGEAIYVGNHPSDDVAGAQSAGLMTVWANMHDRLYSGRVQPDFQIRTIPELLSLPPIQAQLKRQGTLK